MQRRCFVELRARGVEEGVLQRAFRWFGSYLFWTPRQGSRSEEKAASAWNVHVSFIGDPRSFEPRMRDEGGPRLSSDGTETSAGSENGGDAGPIAAIGAQYIEQPWCTVAEPTAVVFVSHLKGRTLGHTPPRQKHLAHSEPLYNY